MNKAKNARIRPVAVLFKPPVLRPRKTNNTHMRQYRDITFVMDYDLIQRFTNCVFDSWQGATHLNRANCEAKYFKTKLQIKFFFHAFINYVLIIYSIIKMTENVN